jgi:6-phosphogluconolactonase
MTVEERIKIYRDPTLEESSRRCALFLTQAAGEAIQARGLFSLVLSGGSTPRHLYELLAEEPHLSAVDWTRVAFFWGDERCVPPDHRDSNYRMAREALLDKVSIPKENIFPMPVVLEPEEEAQQYEATLRRFFGLKIGNDFPRFDLVLLGLGADGHTASLFPGDSALEEKRRLVVAVTPPPGIRPAVPRLSLTLPLLKRARNVWFLVSGEEKKEMVKTIISRSAGSGILPAGMVLPEGDSIWFLSECSLDRQRE